MLKELVNQSKINLKYKLSRIELLQTLTQSLTYFHIFILKRQKIIFVCYFCTGIWEHKNNILLMFFMLIILRIDNFCLFRCLCIHLTWTTRYVFCWALHTISTFASWMTFYVSIFQIFFSNLHEFNSCYKYVELLENFICSFFLHFFRRLCGVERIEAINF